MSREYIDIECSFDADSGLLSRFPARHYRGDFWNGFVDCYVTVPSYLALIQHGLLHGCEPEDYEEMANNVAYAIRERDGWVSLNGLCVFFADQDAEQCDREEYEGWGWQTGGDDGFELHEQWLAACLHGQTLAEYRGND